MIQPAPPEDTSPDPEAQARARAERWVNGGEAPAGTLDGEAWRLTAWALRDICAVASYTDTAQAARAHECLRVAHCITGEREESEEVEALMHWAHAMACIPMGDMQPAIDGVTRACEIFRRIGRDLAAAQAQVVQVIALTMLGQYAQAEELAHRTHAQLVELGDDGAAGKVSLALGTLNLRRHDYEKAAQAYREAAVLCARAGDVATSVAADIGFADSLTATGRFDEALRLFDRARMRAVAHGLLTDEARVGDSIAFLQLARGHYQEALTGLEASIRRYGQLSMPWMQALLERAIADAYLELNLLSQSLDLYDQARVRMEDLDMPDDLGWTLAQRGRALAGLGDTDAADASFRQAVELFQAQDIEVGVLAVQMSRAALSLSLDRAEEALQLVDDVCAGYRQLQLRDASVRADTLRADVLIALGHIELARAQLQAALQEAEGLELLPIQVRCHSGLGQVAMAMADFDEAERRFSHAVALFEDQRRALPSDDLRSAFLADHLLPYRELLGLALARHEAAPTRDSAFAVLDRLDRFRARTLAERLDQRIVKHDDPASGEARARLNWLYRRVSQLRDEGEDPAQLIEEMRRTERQLLEQVRRARIARQDTPAADDSGLDANLAQALCAALSRGEGLVEYGVIDDELFACVATTEGVRVHRHLARWSDVAEAVRAMRFQIDALRHGIAPMQRHLDSLTQRMQARMQRLHALIWAPLKLGPGALQRVLVVTHGSLGSVPLAALLEAGDSTSQSQEAACDVAVVPSMRVALRGLRRASLPPQQVVAIGESGRLAHAGVEAREVAAMFPRAQSFVGPHATTEALRAQAPQADLLHLACHAEFRADNPMFSALHLADAALTVEAAERMTLKPCTVVLSACDTGLSDQGGGDEMLGLVRAFLVGGAARVVASLWPVDDATTAAFMRHFYAALRQGVAPAAALRAAQTATRSEHPHPFFWSAFTLYGGW